MKLKRKFRAIQIDTLVGPYSKVVGDIYYGGGLQIDGTVEGSIVARCEDECVLVVSEEGVVEGEIRGPLIIINGTVHGDVHAGVSIELKAEAKINGNVYYHSLGMAARSPSEWKTCVSAAS